MQRFWRPPLSVEKFSSSGSSNGPGRRPAPPRAAPRRRRTCPAGLAAPGPAACEQRPGPRASLEDTGLEGQDRDGRHNRIVRGGARLFRSPFSTRRARHLLPLPAIHGTSIQGSGASDGRVLAVGYPDEGRMPPSSTRSTETMPPRYLRCLRADRGGQVEKPERLTHVMKDVDNLLGKITDSTTIMIRMVCIDDWMFLIFKEIFLEFLYFLSIYLES